MAFYKSSSMYFLSKLRTEVEAELEVKIQAKKKILASANVRVQEMASVGLKILLSLIGVLPALRRMQSLAI